jgi:hypothetical protein
LCKEKHPADPTNDATAALSTTEYADPKFSERPLRTVSCTEIDHAPISSRDDKIARKNPAL